MYNTFHKCPLALQSLAWVHTHPHSIPLYPVQQIQFTKILFSHLTVGVWCASDTGSVRVSQVSAAVWVAGAQEPPSSLKTWNWKKVQTKWWAFRNAPDQVQIRVHSKPYLSRSVFQTCTFLHLASVPQGEERQLSSSFSFTFSSLSLSSLAECWMRMFRNRIKCILILLIYCSAFARKYQASALGDSSPSFCHQIFWRGKSELILCRMVGRW